MNTAAVIILIVAILAAVACAAYVYLQRRSQRLRARFGPEYDRAVQLEGNRLRAEEALAKRERRMKQLPIRPLLPLQRERFQQFWIDVQARFVDDPNVATNEADRLVKEVMVARGYPVENFDQCAADISVDHPGVVDSYRSGHEIVVRHLHGQATTEDLRRAMIHYRMLFDDLLREAPVAYAEPVHAHQAR